MKTFLLISGILVVCLLGFRILYVKMNGGTTEREWYTSHLHYDFSARVDSVVMLRGDVGLGKIICSLTKGKPSLTVEDSLGRHLTHHKSLRLLLPPSGNNLEFILMGAEHITPGDSIIVHSGNDIIRFFRNGSMFYQNELSTTLEARGNPFTF